MSLLDKIETRNLNIRKQDSIRERKPYLNTEYKTSLVECGFSDVFENSLIIRNRFSIPKDINNTEFIGKTIDIANKQILHFIYKEVLENLNDIRMAILNGDIDSALDACDNLQKETSL